MDRVGIEPTTFCLQSRCAPNYTYGPMSLLKNCEACSKEFSVRPIDLKRGFGKFCSVKCSSKHQNRRKANLITINCSLCEKIIQRKESQIKKSKSGLLFCCKRHKDLAQRLSSGFSLIYPSHYKDGKFIDYRKLAFDFYEHKCSECQFSNILALDVHHKDANRNNNIITNLQILCANCHTIKHRTKATVSR